MTTRSAKGPDAANTAILGSGLGGLLSLYALVQYPHVFGNVGCLSERRPLARTLQSQQRKAAELTVRQYLKRSLSRACNHRLYVDIRDLGQEKVIKTLNVVMTNGTRAKGYTKGSDLIIVTPTNVIDNDLQWGGRIDTALTLLLKGKCPARAERSD